MTDPVPPSGAPAAAPVASGADAAQVKSRVLGGQMPDITAAQIVGLVGAVAGVAISFGVNISKEQQEAILALVGAVAAVLFVADAHVRTRRVRAQAIRHAADKHATSVQHAIDSHRRLSEAALAANQPMPPLIYPTPPNAPEP